MEHPREQFDELLGGTERLPSTVSLLKFANARSQEILALTEAVEEPQNKHLAFQKMPRHLRRRAMSHNVKRMPRRLREIHLSQMEKGGLPIKGKRPSRKFRRKASNLLLEYNRRQRTHVWLETHIWHAKRFHMTSQWGYKLPDSPNNKSFRACYRATARHCLIQDLSYLSCIELQGGEEDILKGLGQLTTQDCGLTFAARASISGNREGNVVVFRKGAYPFRAIGRVTFIWRPETSGRKRTLWIWCHPAFYKEFLHELIAIFGFEVEEMEVENTKEIEKAKKSSKKKNVERLKLKKKSLENLPKYSNKNVEMTLLKDTLNRFRLTGPLAQVVLTEALKFVDIDGFIKKEDVLMDVDCKERPRSEWLGCYSEENSMKCLTQQLAFWKDVLTRVNSADELSPKMIVSATVIDPRLTMPNTRIKAVNDEVCSPQAMIPEGLSAFSPIWNATLRNTVTHSKMAAAELNQLRSRALVPGQATSEWLGQENISHIPLLLVQRPGSQGFGSGWDVIVPAGWGMPVWLGLVYRGARAGGLRETQHLTLEMSQGPVLSPDTFAGRDLADKQKITRMEKHFRLPPDKRVNYVKLGVPAPFHCPWIRLLQDWTSGEVADFYVIRNRHQLCYLESLSQKKPEPKVAFSDTDKICGLVQVELEMCGRGTIGAFSMICNLGKKDLKLAKEKSGRGPLETLHEDVNEEQRKSLRENHLIKLKRLRKKRVKARKELEERGVFTMKEKFYKSPTEEIVKEQAEVMRELWLPSEVKKVKNSCSRNIIGFVMFGDYSFSKSKCIGYGFVALAPLLTILEKRQCQVLVRNVTSLQYNFAKLKVLNHS